MNEPIVSIITPTYNHENFIGQCIESVLTQTYQHWEMIIVDDGSTDRTSEIVQQYKDSRICYLRNEHKGINKLGETYNQALNHASGELIAILEGDDYWPPWKLQKQVEAFYDPNIVLSWGRGAYVNEQGIVIQVTPSAYDLYPKEVIMNRPLGRAVEGLVMVNSFIIPACSIMIRRDTLVQIGGFVQPEGLYWVDRPTALLLSLKGYFNYIDTVLGYWRVHSGQVTQSQAYKATLTAGEWFFRALSYEDKKRFGLISYERAFRGFNYWLHARKALIQGQKRFAFRQLIKALLYPYTPKTARLKALIGIILLASPQRFIIRILSSPLPAPHTNLWAIVSRKTS
jgi:glycosyltransferase involved in cell wall biosynthesis